MVTSEVFYDEDRDVRENTNVQEQFYDNSYQQQEVYQPVVPVDVPAWPLAGSDADVTVSCEQGGCAKTARADNIKIVSKIGSDLVVENNFNLGARDGWSGGANMLHGTQIPVGFDDECARGSEMPLLHREVLEDDGGNVLALSRSGRRNCAKYADGYDAYLARNGLVERTANGDIVTGGGVIGVNGITSYVEGDTEITVDLSAMRNRQIPSKTRFVLGSWPVVKHCERFCNLGATKKVGIWYGPRHVNIQFRPVRYSRVALSMSRLRLCGILNARYRCHMPSSIRGIVFWLYLRPKNNLTDCRRKNRC